MFKYFFFCDLTWICYALTRSFYIWVHVSRTRGIRSNVSRGSALTRKMKQKWNIVYTVGRLNKSKNSLGHVTNVRIDIAVRCYSKYGVYCTPSKLDIFARSMQRRAQNVWKCEVSWDLFLEAKVFTFIVTYRVESPEEKRVPAHSRFIATSFSRCYTMSGQCRPVGYYELLSQCNTSTN